MKQRNMRGQKIQNHYKNQSFLLFLEMDDNEEVYEKEAIEMEA